MRRERGEFSEFSKNFLVLASRVFQVSRARVFRSLVPVFEISDYSQSNKEMAYVTREGYLQEELLTELIDMYQGF